MFTREKEVVFRVYWLPDKLKESRLSVLVHRNHRPVVLQRSFILAISASGEALMLIEWDSCGSGE